MRIRAAASRRLREQRGFTLIELLVAMSAGVVVTAALFTILDVTLRQTTRTFSRVDATQRARTALETIGNEMHSACVEDQVIPIRKDSNANNVIFLSAYGGAINPTPLIHKLAFDPTGGTLRDTTYTATGNAPNWTYDASAPVDTTTILTNVAQSGSTPVFQYYASAATGQVAVTPSGTGLTETQSESVTEVRMTLVVKPAGGSGVDPSLTPNTVTNSVVLRLTPIPNPGSPGKDFFPCA